MFWYLFHVLVPASLCLFGGCIFYESSRFHSKTAAHFRLPVCILALFAILEIINYYLLPVQLQISSFFQTGILVFILMMSVQCGHFIQYAFQIQTKNRQLEYELFLAEKQREMQKERYALLSETAASLKAQRHDLHHQLAVIRNYNENGEKEKLDSYLSGLIAKIPVAAEKALCTNEAVNAVALYYHAMAKKAGIQDILVSLDIPSDTGCVPESDLCVIVGNLLENALAACSGLNGNPAFIHMHSRLQYGILTITMDNSCPDIRPEADGSFRSQKAGGGTGLISIRAVAEKYEGNARFTAENGIFSSSVYLRLDIKKP